MKKFLPRLIPNIFLSNNIDGLSDLFNESSNRNDVYEKSKKYFYQSLPYRFVRHRKFFSKNGRGFGEDAFHTMWYLLFMQYRPINCLEIGVYRGQTISLWAMLSEYLKINSHIACISPFSSAGDEVSNYLKHVDYLSDTLNNFKKFNLQPPEICKAFSTEKKATDFIQSKKWDLIYIDGSHDYDVVKHDLDISIKSLSNNGIIVMDDSSLYFDYIAKSGSFAGHPGPSQVAKEIACKELHLIGGVGHNNIFIK